MTTSFREFGGSPVERFGPNGLTAERRFLCAYEDRYAVLAALLGGGSLSGPAPYPGWPGAVAVQVRIEPYEKRPDAQGAFSDPATQINSYSGQFVEIVVTYEFLRTEDGSLSSLPAAAAGTFLTYRLDFASQSLVVPGWGLHWQADAAIPVPPDAAPPLRIPIAEHYLAWHGVAAPPWDAIRAATGTVNDSPFLGAATETLLFDGAKAERQFLGLDGSQQAQCGWRVSYTFREKSVKLLNADSPDVACGWNHGYRDMPYPESCWDRLVDRSGNSLYRTSSFAALFEFPAS